MCVSLCVCLSVCLEAEVVMRVEIRLIADPQTAVRWVRAHGLKWLLWAVRNREGLDVTDQHREQASES